MLFMLDKESVKRTREIFDFFLGLQLFFNLGPKAKTLTFPFLFKFWNKKLGKNKILSLDFLLFL